MEEPVSKDPNIQDLMPQIVSIIPAREHLPKIQTILQINFERVLEQNKTLNAQLILSQQSAKLQQI